MMRHHKQTWGAGATDGPRGLRCVGERATSSRSSVSGRLINLIKDSWCTPRTEETCEGLKRPGVFGWSCSKPAEKIQNREARRDAPFPRLLPEAVEARRVR